MPVQPTYPGVYIEEIPSGVRTISGVATSVAAFIGQFRRGPLDQPVQLFNLGDFERELGGLLATSEASYAIQQFFLNGGTEAWAVRVAGGTPAKASVAVPDESGGTAFTVRAVSEGAWGDALRVAVDHKTSTPASLFNLTVSEDGAGGRTEVFRNLSMSNMDPRFVKTVVDDGSKLVWIDSPASGFPAQNGTVSKALVEPLNLSSALPELGVRIGSATVGPYYEARLTKPTAPQKTVLEARSLLESAIRAARPADPAFAGATVEAQGKQLRILAGPTTPSAPTTKITFTTAASDLTAAELFLKGTAASNAIVSAQLGTAPAPGSTPLKLKINSTDDVVLPLTGSTWADVQAALQTAIINQGDNPNAIVALYQTTNETYLVIVPDTGNSLTFAAAQNDPTTAGSLGLTSPTTGTAVLFSGDLSAFPALSSKTPKVVATVGATTQTVALASVPKSLPAARLVLDQALAGLGAKVAVLGSKLVVFAIPKTTTLAFAEAPIDNTTVGELLLDTATENDQLYALGSGSDGDLPDGAALIGDSGLKTGIYALEKVDLFNILCIPRTALVPGGLDDVTAKAVMTVAITYCEKRRAMFLMDTPAGMDTVQEIKDWLDGAATLRSKNAALYFPRVQVGDPLNEFRLRDFGASGTIAGLYARTDASRGVWKAPAGTEAALTNVQALDAKLSDSENGALNPLAINTLRSFPVYGNVCWGARTLAGADQIASEWKYVPVRRLALYLEESLYRGTQWVVFEPNDEPLWAQIRLNIGAFMHTLFRQGAFQGSSPRDAYLVKCDAETTTQDDINRGVVNILVGFAPLKPAEFVILQIQQLAGQIQT